MATCPSCAAELAGSPRFCPDCGTRLEPAAPAREVRKTVTVLFSDVTGSTALGEQLDPESLRSIMGRYFAMMKTVIERHGGTVEKFIGDAVMAVFGIPTVHEDDALRAVRAAAAIGIELEALNAELLASRGIMIRFRTGLNTGEVVAGDPASGQTLVTGDTVNTAARLEQAAPPGEILLGALTWSLVRDAVEVEPSEPIAAKGKAQPLAAYRLIRVRPGAAGRSRRPDAPLVGRERELERLAQAFRQTVTDRSCGLFTLLGSAGVGKSRLVAEFEALVGAEARVLHGHCLSYGEGITYWPIGEIVRAAAGITEADSAEAARAKVRELLAGEREADILAARISSAIGLSGEAAPQEEIFWAIRKLLEHLARVQPLVVVIEDIHWAESTLLDLLEQIADWSRDAPIFVLCPARPELLDVRTGWGGGKLNATTVLLEALPADATGRLIAALPGGAALPDPVVERITVAAEGNPLYVEELLAMLVDDGLLREQPDGTWAASPDIAEVRVPPTISALLAARLEQLDPAERAVVERASVVGRVFEQAAVAELSDETLRAAVGRSLLALVRKELVRPDRSELSVGDAFRFRHILIRDAAYGALPKADRAALHERFADWLERTSGERLTELEEIVGHHLAEAHRYRTELGESGDRLDALARRATDRLAAAGIRARRHGDARAAAELLDAALTLARPDDVDPVVASNLVSTLVDVGEFERAEHWIDVGTVAAARHGSAAGAARMRLAEGRWASFTMHEDREPEHDELEQLREVLEAAGDHQGLAEVWASIAGEHWWRLRAQAAATATAQSVKEARLASNRAAEDSGRAWQLMLTAMGPAPAAEIERLCGEAIDDASAGIRLRAMGLELLAVVRAGEGRFDDGRAVYLESRRLIADLNLPLLQAMSAFTLVSIERMAGDEPAAERAARESYELLQSVGEQAYAEGLLAVLAQTLEAQNRDDEALAIAGPDIPESTYDGILHRMVRAKVLAKRGALIEALPLITEAVALADSTDITAIRADVRLNLAQVLRMAGREPEARAAAAEAAVLYDEKGVPVMAHRARAMAASVSS